MTRKQKRILKRKLRRIKEMFGEVLLGIGFVGLMIFGAAIDGPGNDMTVVYSGLFSSLVLLGAGGTMAGEVEI